MTRKAPSPGRGALPRATSSPSTSAVAAEDFSLAFTAPAGRSTSSTACAAEAGSVATTTGFGIDALAGLEALDARRHDRRSRAIATSAIRPPEPALEALRRAAERGARVFSICTGAFALAHAGLLDGRRATTHWFAAAKLAEPFPAVDVEADSLYVETATSRPRPGSAPASTSACTWSAPTTASGPAPRLRGRWSRRRTATAARRSSSSGRCPSRRHRSTRSALGARPPRRAARRRRPSPPAPASARGPSPAGSSPRPERRRSSGCRPSGCSRRGGCSRRTELAVEEVATRAGFGSAPSLREHFRRATATSPTAYRRAFAT